MLINLMTATGGELDRAGAMHEKKRRGGEPDEEYRQRLIDPTPSDGGPAFPSDSHRYGPTPGMSIRDYFAAKAMQGMSGAFQDVMMEVIEESIPIVAKISYAMADAMLAARGESK